MVIAAVMKFTALVGLINCPKTVHSGSSSRSFFHLEFGLFPGIHFYLNEPNVENNGGDKGRPGRRTLSMPPLHPDLVTMARVTGRNMRHEFQETIADVVVDKLLLICTTLVLRHVTESATEKSFSAVVLWARVICLKEIEVLRPLL